MKTSSAFFVATVILAMASLAVWMLFAEKLRPNVTRGEAVSSPPASTIGDKATANAGRSNTAATPTSAAPKAGPAVFASSRDNPYLSEYNAPNRADALRRLTAIDSPAAALTAAEIVAACAPYADNMYDNTIKDIESAQRPVEIKAMQRQIAERQRSRCVGIGSADMAKGSERSAYTLKIGDPRGVAVNLPITKQPIPERIAAAQDAVKLQDPFAIREVGAFFLRRTDLPNGFEYDLGNGVTASPRILFDAFGLAACEYGLDCGADHVRVTARCVFSGHCDSSNLEEMLVRYQYPPADAQRLLAARQIVLAGLRTGQWPANFWTGRPR